MRFPLLAVHFIGIHSVTNMRFSLMMALIATAAFPSYLIAPAVFLPSLSRYRSNKSDYAVGFGIFAVACLLVTAAALSHVLATAKDDPL